MKKKEKKVVVSPVIASVKLEEVSPKCEFEKCSKCQEIGKLELNFNNDGLNNLAAKINEIIDALQK